MAELQDVCDLLMEIRDAILGGRTAGNPAKAVGVGNNVAHAGLRVDSSARLAFWNGQRLAINSHADFSILSRLVAAKGALVSYHELERAINPALFLNSTGGATCTVAPQDVKDAVQHIKAAFRKASYPLLLESVRMKGYRLQYPTNNLLSSTLTTPCFPSHVL